MAHAAVVFNTPEGCVPLPAQGDVTAVTCFGDSTGNGSTVQNFMGTGSGILLTATLPLPNDFTVKGTPPVIVESLGTRAVDQHVVINVSI